MPYINDVGGMAGFGPVPVPERGEDEPAFHAEWEARVFALNYALIACGLYTLDEFRHAVERMDPAHYLSSSYYEKWLSAIETLTTEKAVR